MRWRVSPDAQVLIGNMEATGNTAILATSVDRAQRLEVDYALERVGGTWDSQCHAYVFSGDARDAIDEVFFDAKAEYLARGEFATPSELAVATVARAGIAPGMRILEPSAGGGSLLTPILAAVRDIEPEFEKGVPTTADALTAAWASRVPCVELNAKRCSALEQYGYKPRVADFLTLTPDDVGGQVDRVIMAPPFTRQQDLDHIHHAYAVPPAWRAPRRDPPRQQPRVGRTGRPAPSRSGESRSAGPAP